MASNYWTEQHAKEALAADLRKHLEGLFGGVFSPENVVDIAKAIKDYVGRHGQRPYAVHFRINLEDHTITIEIP